MEIAEHESTIETLEKLAKDYRMKGAATAADRLEQQAQLLNVCFLIRYCFISSIFIIYCI